MAPAGRKDAGERTSRECGEGVPEPGPAEVSLCAPRSDTPSRGAEGRATCAPGSAREPAGWGAGECSILSGRSLPLFRPLGQAPRHRPALAPGSRRWTGSEPPATGNSVGRVLPTERDWLPEDQQSSRNDGTRTAGLARGEPGAGAAGVAADRVSVCSRAGCPFVASNLWFLRSGRSWSRTETAPPFVCW